MRFSFFKETAILQRCNVTYGAALYRIFDLVVFRKKVASDVGETDMVHILPLTVALISVCLVSSEDVGKPCTYFGGGRVSSPQGNLVNCSWYSSNACCQRTEVTSVFGGMYPLYGASRECSNQLNYLMCYFCSPRQHLWYHEKAYICADYCRSIHDDCKTAMYHGESVGASYQSGEDFCRGLIDYFISKLTQI
ncbi:hypothetical protein LSAT2_030331 [Lamellibrachia satsuma]|nr:hypothetical protein LSAT2_030331 [Lamellibrachia satsuma]